MNYRLNDKLRALEPYTPDTGSYRVRLDANESFLSLSAELEEKVRLSVSTVPLMRYPDPLAEECCRRFGEYYQVDPRYVTAGNGSDELISVIIGAFTQRGDSVLTVSPDFSMYDFYSSLAECRVVRLPKNPDLTIDVDRFIETANAENCKMVLFSNPCNPTSLGLCREDVRRIIRGVHALVVLDEAYMDFWDQSLIAEAEDYDNLILLRTCSKMIGLAAIRLGFAVANLTVTRALRAAKSPYNVNSLTQAVGAAVLSEPGYLHSAVKKILESRDALYSQLSGLPGVTVFKPCTNFILMRCSDAARVFEQLKKQGILVRCFGDYLRITAGTEEENAAVAAALRKLMN